MRLWQIIGKACPPQFLLLGVSCPHGPPGSYTTAVVKDVSRDCENDLYLPCEPVF